jgi:hypothetical protein
MRTECHYPTDVSAAQWEGLQLLLPRPNRMPMAYALYSQAK